MYIIGYYWEEGYDFLNSNGEHVKGSTRKALVLTLDAADNVCRSNIAKVARECKPLPVGKKVESVYYDVYGKIVGVSV